MKKFLLFFLVAMLSLVTIYNACFLPIEAVAPEYVPSTSSPAVEATLLEMEYVPLAPSSPTVEPTLTEPETDISDEDVALIALMTMTEAEGEPEEGQRLVIDSVLNRVDDPHFPDTIYDVIWQPNQYSGMQPPRIDRCYVKDKLVQLVREELENRTNYDVIFFRAERFSDYGVPMFQLGNHYFSSYD